MKRLLIIGCGDVALRMLPALRSRYRIFALTHTRERLGLLRARGIVPVPGDLDHPDTLGALGGLAHDVVHFAPPPNRGPRDCRTVNLLAALTRGGSLPRHLVYISTTGVYGNCDGELVVETRTPRPATERAKRRADAELRLRNFSRRTGMAVSILRVPGIYAADRLPLERLRAGLPVLTAEEDSYTNHVHADDLANIVVAALRAGKPCRVYNATDDSSIKMGDYFDHVADSFGLPRPPRVPRADAMQRLPANLLSFLGESRRLSNQRVKRELRIKLRYPTVKEGLAEAVRIQSAEVRPA